MKSIYEASTALDAYMVLNLLEQEGILGRVDGEYLPGGVGELQAINLVRVMVDEVDYEKAAQVIRDWEAIQVDKEEKTKNETSSRISVFLIGVVIGGGLVYWAYNSPVTEGGIDMDGDGVLDEKWIYKDNRISRTEVDRNYDGSMDVIYSFDRRGILQGSRQDDNFDGIFESVFIFEDGLTHSLESDLNQDGNIDYKARFRHGNIDEIIIIGKAGTFVKNGKNSTWGN